jgi:putative tricarboxylic transport membrane protein
LLYPAILVFCVLGVYAVNGSVIDIGIMTVMGALGYALRKFDFEAAPVVLGLVLAPMMEMSFRQSLAMSSGSYSIFLIRPIASVLLTAGLALLLLNVVPIFMKKADWRHKVGFVSGQDQENI